MRYVGFKYMYVSKDRIFLTNEVSYISEGQYNAYDPWWGENYVTSKCVAETEEEGDAYIFKLDDAIIAQMAELIRRVIYNQRMYQPLIVSDLNGIQRTIVFNINGMVFYGRKDTSRPVCVMSCPKTINRADTVTLYRMHAFSINLVPCDEKGNPYFTRPRSSVTGFSKRCNEVYNVIFDNPGIDTVELIRTLGWPDRNVTSRLSELCASGRVKCVGRHVNPESGRKISEWVAYRG